MGFYKGISMAQVRGISLFRGTAINSLVTLLSRFLGFFRDLGVAHLFGAAPLADAFFVAFRIPNLFRSLLAEGSFSAAFVPVIGETLERSPGRVERVVRSALSSLILASSCVTLFVIIFRFEVLELIAPGFGNGSGREDLSANLLGIMMPYLIAVSVVALAHGYLQSTGRFGASGLAQVVQNIVFILGVLVAAQYDSMTGIYILAWSVPIGGIVQILVQWWLCRRAGLQLLPSTELTLPETRTMLKLFLPATGNAALYQIGILVSTIFASLLPSGSVSWLFYADRVTQLPVGIFTVALSQVLLPALSRSAVGDVEGFSRTTVTALRWTVFMILPLAVGMALFANDLVQLVFERGSFLASDTIATAVAVQALCAGIVFSGIHSMLVRVLQAKKDTITPTLVSLGSLFVSVILSVILMGDIQGASLSAHLVNGARQAIGDFLPLASLAHVGLALSSSVSSLTALVLTGLILMRRERSISWAECFSSWLRVAVAASFAAGIVIYSPSQLLILKITLFASMYVFALWLVGSRELRETFLLLRRLR